MLDYGEVDPTLVAQWPAVRPIEIDLTKNTSGRKGDGHQTSRKGFDPTPQSLLCDHC